MPNRIKRVTIDYGAASPSCGYRPDIAVGDSVRRVFWRSLGSILSMAASDQKTLKNLERRSLRGIPRFHGLLAYELGIK